MSFTYINLNSLMIVDIYVNPMQNLEASKLLDLFDMDWKRPFEFVKWYFVFLLKYEPDAKHLNSRPHYINVKF